MPYEALQSAAEQLRAQALPEDSAESLTPANDSLLTLENGSLPADDAKRAANAGSSNPRGHGRGAVAFAQLLAHTQAHGQATPGSIVPVIVVSEGHLDIARMTWGYEAPWKQGKLLFNTRLEDALAKPQGMWAESLAQRRCAVPTLGFFEPDRSRMTTSPKTGRQIKQQVFFSPACGGVMFLAGIHQDGRFSVMTTSPNAVVSPVHDRMPVALSPAEVNAWLGSSYAQLADRSEMELSATDETMGSASASEAESHE